MKLVLNQIISVGVLSHLLEFIFVRNLALGNLHIISKNM